MPMHRWRLLFRYARQAWGCQWWHGGTEPHDRGPTCLKGGLGAPLGAGLTLSDPCRLSPPQTRVERCRCIAGDYSAYRGAVEDSRVKQAAQADANGGMVGPGGPGRGPTCLKGDLGAPLGAELTLTPNADRLPLKRGLGDAPLETRNWEEHRKAAIAGQFKNLNEPRMARTKNK